MPRITVTAYKESIPEKLIRLDIPIREENKQWRWTRINFHTEDIKGFEDTEEGETLLSIWDDDRVVTLCINEEFESFEARLKAVEEGYEIDWELEEESPEEAENE